MIDGEADCCILADVKPLENCFRTMDDKPLSPWIKAIHIHSQVSKQVVKGETHLKACSHSFQRHRNTWVLNP